MRFRVAIDGYRLVGPPTSVGTYTEELLDALLEEDIEVVLLVPHDEPGSLLEGIRKRLPRIEIVSPTTAESPYDDWGKLVRWNQWTLPKLLDGLGVDVLISTYHQVPIRAPGNVAKLAIIHDCCGLRADCGYRQYGRAWWRHWSNLKSSAIFADAVVPISWATHDDFLRLYPGSRARLIEPIYNRVSREVLDPNQVLPTVEQLNLTSGGYLLAFSLAGRRKGTDIALRAYNEYRINGGSLPLVLMGDGKLDLESWGLLPEFVPFVIRAGRVSDDLRDALYAHAKCFLFFSRCEGFGYPIIEAARQGCPVVAWSKTTAREILGETIPLMESLTSSEGAKLIMQYEILGETQRISIRKRLIARSEHFRGESFGREFTKAIRFAVSRKAGGHNGANQCIPPRHS